MELIHAEWPLRDKVICCSTIVNGGVSKGPYASLNLGAHVGDDAANVTENRQRLNSYLSKQLPYIKPVHWLNQTHSTKCVSLEASSNDKLSIPISADAAYSQSKAQPCVVMTADCMAIMLVDAAGTQIAAVHAGWRGLIDGVIENTLGQFICPKADIYAWFAPAISASNFEVGQDVADLFGAYPESLSSCDQENKYLLDLQLVASQKLTAVGVKHQYFANMCTYSSGNLFSHRRATHQNFKACGRMANLIVIK
ncbi:MAG: peptidoglycan editing factor PgeF [Glaciecola sp.]